jgi:Legionella pneumophila major outer membrane protein precursor
MKLRTWATAALAACLVMATSAPLRAQSGEEISPDAMSAGMGPADMMHDDGAYGAYDSCDTCSTGGCCDEGGMGGMVGRLSGGRNVQLIAGAEYIYAQATFSDALAYVEQDTVAGGETFHQLDFDHESSYSFYGGAYLPDCGGAVIFDYTRMTSSADFAVNDSAFVNIFGAFEMNGDIEGDADVELNSYDVSFSKTIPLGCLLGGAGCGDCCDDACAGGCGTGCGWCPAWDITWSGGVRFADVGWDYRVAELNSNQSTTSSLDFDGFGGRVGLMGRRYIGKRGLFSIYGKGDWSLLFGEVDLNLVQSDLAGDAFIRTSNDITVPVTEIELGASSHLGQHATLSAGYFWSAWHDLGMSPTTELNGLTAISHYDDANILGWNGFFARAEVAF